MKPEYILNKDNIRKLVKFLSMFEGKSLTQLKIAINQKFNKSDTLENLTNKLRNKTVKVVELLEIFEILGYDIILRKK